MGSIEGFITENSIDGEDFPGSEDRFFGDVKKHLGGDGSCVGSKNVLLSFFEAPFVIVADGAKASFLVDCLYFFYVFLREFEGCGGGFEEESVMGVSSWVLLGLEQSIEVPET